MENNENPIEKLLDIENNEPVTLYDEKDNGIKFEQIALIPYEDQLYAILKPIEKMEGVASDEAVIFIFEEDEVDKAQFLRVVNDDNVIEKVFAIYLKLAKEEIKEEKKAKSASKAKSTKKTPEKTTAKAKAPEKKPMKATATTAKKAEPKKATSKTTAKKAEPKKPAKK